MNSGLAVSTVLISTECKRYGIGMYFVAEQLDSRAGTDLAPAGVSILLEPRDRLKLSVREFSNAHANYFASNGSTAGGAR